MSQHLLASIAVCFLLPVSLASAELVQVEVGFDRWMYPFNGTPGSRATGSVFGALGSDDFDNRDAQLIFGFDVSGVAPRSNDQVLASLTLRLTSAGADTFVYDPTPDPLESYLGAPDVDGGRPLELFGVGVRNGLIRPTLDASSRDPRLFKESSPYSTMAGVHRSSRSLFAADTTGQDVSNHVSAGRAVSPWAVGQAVGLPPGSSVPNNTEFLFSIDLADPGIAQYVDTALSMGQIYFALSSLHSASQAGPPSFPSFYLDAAGARLGPTALLEFQYAQVPEPSNATQVALALAALVATGRLAMRKVANDGMTLDRSATSA